MNQHFFVRGISALFAAAMLCLPGLAAAHGSMTTPPSRIYYCYLNGAENPTDPGCIAIRQNGGTPGVYDWMSVNQANANGNHQAVVADGKLCSGNNPLFTSLDLPRTDWHTTPITASGDGTFEFAFRGTAPHATRDWIFYVSRPEWSPTQPLRWADVEEFCRLGNVALNADGHYYLRCPLPAATGKRVIYSVWQRSDSAEAFYTCVDVDFGSGPDAIFANGFQQ